MNSLYNLNRNRLGEFYHRMWLLLTLRHSLVTRFLEEYEKDVSCQIKEEAIVNSTLFLGQRLTDFTIECIKIAKLRRDREEDE